MTRKLLALIALVFLVVIAGGLVWLAVQSDNAVSVSLSFVAGPSMIFLPYTLPSAFVIVPIAAREKASKGLGLAVVQTF